MIRRVLCVPILLIAAAALWSAEGKTVLEVTNDTGFILSALYIEDIDSERWGEDLLGGNPLLNGESILIPLASLATPIVNIRARDEEGDTYTVYGVEAGSEDITIVLSDIDPD
jgi:hypothetical protein